jgi:hypothetical protein
MQTTLQIDDAIYRKAKAVAERKGVTLMEFIEEALRLMLSRAALKTGEMTEEESGLQREEFARLLDELDAKPLKDGPSVGSLNREELYQRGAQAEAETSQDDAKRAAFLERLQHLFDQADERDRLKENSARPFTREELYAERLDRFR